MKTTHTSGQLNNFLILLEQKGVTPEDFQKRLESGVLADAFDSTADLSDRPRWRVAFKLGPLDGSRITVDYHLSLDQMIATGNYDWKNGDITAKRFPIMGEGVVEYEVKLFHFNHKISSEQVVKAITSADAANPWEPGRIEHLLAFGAKYPEEQCKYPIVALGSSCKVHGDRGVPYLGRDDSGRLLYLDWWSDDWIVGYRFPAVRQISGS